MRTSSHAAIARRWMARRWMARRWCALSVLAVLAPAIAGCASAGPARSAGPTILAVDTCHDSPGQQGSDPGVRLVNGVEGFVGDPNPYDTPLKVTRNGHRYLAWKFALAVAPDAGPYRTVRVLHPASAWLAYPRRLAAGVRLPVCGHRYTLYAGGVFITKPGCVTLAVTGPAGKAVTVTMPVLVASC
jgi:hypothetical protein